MRKYTSTIMIIVLILSLTGCTGQAGNAAVTETTTQAATEATKQAATEATKQAAAEATTEALTYEEVYIRIETYVNEALESTSDKTLKQDEDGNILLIVSYSDGTEIAKAAKEGDNNSTETWQKLIERFSLIGAEAHDYLDQNGFGDKYFGSCLVNEKNTDKYLLLCKNDTVIYDIVNGVGVEEGDEDELEDTFKEGETFKVGNLEITMTKKKLGFEADDPYGFHELPDGYEYLKCSWTYKNVGESDAYCSVYDFKCYADDKECDQEYFDADFINSNLGSGRSVDFETYYKVPNKAKTIELEYTTLLGQGKKAVIKIK